MDDITQEPLLDSSQGWLHFNRQRERFSVHFPTEWVVRTLAGANYPTLKLDKTHYRGARILDLGCGDGRNLALLSALEFEIHATEISEEMVADVEKRAKKRGWDVDLKVGTNSKIPFPDEYFNYVLSCSSCYYLKPTITWPEVMSEIARVIPAGGIFIGNLPAPDNSLLAHGQTQADGSVIIVDDPFGLRNGIRFMVARDYHDVGRLLKPCFEAVGVGHLRDDFYGLVVSAYIFAARKI